jgi:hypothetical protein
MATEHNVDDELLARFVGGDAEGFVEFYRRHRAAVLAYFLRRTGDVELTADLTAEVFAAALISARRYRPGSTPAFAVSDQLLPGMVTAVKYRDGTTCRPRHILVPRHETRGCSPVGYVAPPHAHLTSAEVRAPISATVKSAARWCANSSGHYVACDVRVPAGYRILRSTAGMVLLQWSWVARVAAPGANSGYEYAITGGPPCGGKQSSSSPIAARRGQRIVQQSLGSFACAQRETISVEYRTNVGPGGANFASPADPGHDGQPFVGSTSIDVPR